MDGFKNRFDLNKYISITLTPMIARVSHDSSAANEFPVDFKLQQTRKTF